MDNEDIFSKVETEGDFEYIRPEDFVDLNLPEVLPPYEGEGSTSFKSKYDLEKLEYMNRLGIEVPREWMSDYRNRGLFVSSFIVLGNILVSERIRRRTEHSPESFRESLLDRNRQLEKARLDEFGYRRDVGGILVEEDFAALGFSSNPQKKISKEELKLVVGHVLDQLKKD
jgi:hypothetical protein